MWFYRRNNKKQHNLKFLTTGLRCKHVNGHVWLILKAQLEEESAKKDRKQMCKFFLFSFNNKKQTKTKVMRWAWHAPAVFISKTTKGKKHTCIHTHAHTHTLGLL